MRKVEGTVSAGRWIWEQAPMLFVYAVLAYFGLAALNVDDRISSVDLPATAAHPLVSPDPAGSTENTTTPASAGALDIAVTSLRALPNDGRIVVNVTLEIDNTAQTDVKFQSGNVILRAADGTERRAEQGPRAPMTIDPNMSQLAPLTFALPAGTEGPYSLKYVGHTLFHGYSI